MLVKEIMTSEVVTIDVTASVFDACMIYKEKKVGCLVVTDSGKCAGIVTERDLIEKTICLRKNPEKTMISEVMSSDLKTVHPLDTIEKALEVIRVYKIKKLPVIQNERMVGIVTITDISEARPDISRRFMETWVKAEWRD